MSDDRYITFQEYVRAVVSAGPKRQEDLKDLINFFGMPTLERVLAGKTIIEPKDFVSGKPNGDDR